MQDFTEIDLKRLILALFHKAWLLVLCALVAGALAYIYTANFITPLYRASVSIYVNNANPQMVNSSYISGSDLATAQRLVNTYVNIIRSDTVLEKVAQQSGLDITTNQIRGMMTAESVENTEIFNINISKMMSSNKPEIDTLNESELHYMQSQLALKIAQKLKLMMSSLEEYTSHDLLVESHFHYDQPQQAVYDQIQQYLNLMATSDAIQTITNP